MKLQTLETSMIYASPVGDLLLTRDGAALTGLHFLEVDDPVSRKEASFQNDSILSLEEDTFSEVTTQLDEYFAGKRQAFHFKSLSIRLDGTVFQKRVWQALCHIPYGQTISYGELASRIGQPTASRAVGLANGRNPISILIPCHRVIGTNGKLVGYGGGLDRKRKLLEIEHAIKFNEGERTKVLQ